VTVKTTMADITFFIAASQELGEAIYVKGGTLTDVLSAIIQADDARHLSLSWLLAITSTYCARHVHAVF